MVKIVYKITNKINNKIYIGQTNNLKRRIQEHKHDKRNNHPIHNAIKKYGWENFEIEILYQGENYNEEEKKWITYYDSRNKTKGYNIVSGGQDSCGEDNPMAKITQSQANDVMDLLQHTNKSYKEMSSETGVSIKNIIHINFGESWAKTDIVYPIRQMDITTPKFIVDKIYKLILKSNLTFHEISKFLEIPIYIIRSINKGNTHKREGFTYPLRTPIETDSKIKSNQVKKFLKNSNLSYKEIAKLTDTTINNVSKINLGKMYKDETINYPIRKNK